jgi:hypothetical protein
MANKISLSAIQNAFLKRLIWKRYRNRIPENEQTRVLIEQFLLRIKIDSRNQGFDPDQAIDIARPYIAKVASWYDVESFPWKSRDKLKLLRSKALGEALAITERECFLCKPRRGGVGITPIDAGKDKQVQQWIRAAQRKSADKRNAKLRAERREIRESLETEVRRLVGQGLSYTDIAERFANEHRDHPSARGIHIWTERHVFAFDPDRKNPEHKRKFEAERKRMKRQAMTGRERKAAQIEEARRLIYALHFEGEGHASIARILNEWKIPSRRGGKWHKKSVKRELAEGDKGGRKRPVSPVDYTEGQMTGERAGRQSPAISGQTLRGRGIQEDIRSGPFQDVAILGDDAHDK